jgi:two-component system LytT family response regulator
MTVSPIRPAASESPLRVLVVDDEPLAREQLRDLLAAHHVTSVTECGDGPAAVQAILALQPDLVYLDVAMPGLSGFEVVDRVGAERMPAVVFVTAFHEHALRAFETHAVDYLVKPVSAERFAASFRRARHHAATRDTRSLADALRSVVRELAPSPHRRQFLVRRGERLVVVAADELESVEAARNYVELHGAERSSLFRATFASVEEQLDPRQFARIHRGVMVNVGRVAHLVRGRRGELAVVLRGGRTLPVHRRYAGRLKELLGGALSGRAPRDGASDTSSVEPLGA